MEAGVLPTRNRGTRRPLCPGVPQGPAWHRNQGETNIKINGKPYQILEDATAWRWDLGKSGKSERRVRILTKVSIAESLVSYWKRKMKIFPETSGVNKKLQTPSPTPKQGSKLTLETSYFLIMRAHKGRNGCGAQKNTHLSHAYFIKERVKVTLRWSFH